jgi:hypothetical protein
LATIARGPEIANFSQLQARCRAHITLILQKTRQRQRKRPAAGGAAALHNAPPQAGRPSSVPEGSASPHGEAASQPAARAKQCAHLSFKHARVSNPSIPGLTGQQGVLTKENAPPQAGRLHIITPRRRRGGHPVYQKKRPTAW